MYIKHSEAAADSLVVHQRLRQRVLGSLGRRPSCEDNMLWCRIADDIDMTRYALLFRSKPLRIDLRSFRANAFAGGIPYPYRMFTAEDALASQKSKIMRSGILVQLAYPVLSHVLGLPFLWTQTNCDSKSPSQIHTHVDTAKLMPSVK